MNTALKTIVTASVEKLYEQHQSRTLNRYIRTTNAKMKELMVLALDFRGLQKNINEQPSKDKRSQSERIEIFLALQDQIMDTILEILPEDLQEEYYAMVCNSYDDQC